MLEVVEQKGRVADLGTAQAAAQEDYAEQMVRLAVQTLEETVGQADYFEQETVEVVEGEKVEAAE